MRLRVLHSHWYRGSLKSHPLFLAVRRIKDRDLCTVPPRMRGALRSPRFDLPSRICRHSAPAHTGRDGNVRSVRPVFAGAQAGSNEAPGSPSPLTFLWRRHPHPLPGGTSRRSDHNHDTPPHPHLSSPSPSVPPPHPPPDIPAFFVLKDR